MALWCTLPSLLSPPLGPAAESLSYQVISSFDKIQQDPQSTLLVLDIDETILHFPMFPPNQISYNSISELEHWSLHIPCFKPVATDLCGLKACLTRFSSCLFLTARNQELKSLTLQHLRDIGLQDVESLIIHFSNGKSKGSLLSELVKNHSCQDIVFVDDQLLNLKDVAAQINQKPVHLYLFLRNR